MSSLSNEVLNLVSCSESPKQIRQYRSSSHLESFCTTKSYISHQLLVHSKLKRETELWRCVSTTLIQDYELMSSPAPPSSVCDPEIAPQVSQDPPMIRAPVSPYDSDPTLPESEFNRFCGYILTDYVYHSCSRCHYSAFECTCK